jgi:hypothetical protein
MASGLPDFRSPIQIAASEILQAAVTIAGQTGNISVSLAEAVAEVSVNLAAQVNNIAVSIADQVGNIATDITAQTLAALNTDYRYGTAGASVGSVPIDDSPITLVSITGKGIIFGGSWIIDHDESGVQPSLQNIIKYIIDGEQHEFRSLYEALNWQLSDACAYQPSITTISSEFHSAAGYLPGNITFEDSFEVIVESLNITGIDEIDARVFYAISL